jgi:hypothetical protein
MRMLWFEAMATPAEFVITRRKSRCSISISRTRFQIRYAAPSKHAVTMCAAMSLSTWEEHAQVQKIYIKDASKYGVHIPGLQDKW